MNLKMKFYVTTFLVIIYILSIQGIILERRFRLPPVDPISARMAKPPMWNRINQKLDHFNPQDLREWSMRYLSNDQFYRSGGPIMLFVGGEWEIEQDYLMTGQIFDMAHEHHGYLFYTEHRFYGRSFPKPDTTVESLKYLSVEQSLADIVYFINFVKDDIEGLKNSKVVVAGGSYAGSMAAWLRLKYPHIVDIAYSSSAPMEATSSYTEYFKIVRSSIARVSPECVVLIADAIKELSEKLKTEAGIAFASKTLYTCDLLSNEEPHRTYTFTTVIAEAIAGVVQNSGVVGIHKMCNTMSDTKGTAFEKLASYIRAQYNSSCISGYDAFLDTYRNITITDNIYRSWIYQTCTEFGYFQTTSEPFIAEQDANYHIKLCAEIFNNKFGAKMLREGIKRSNLLYGGKTPKITKTVFVQGDIDPWHSLGITKDLNPLAPAILINGSTHCSDIVSISPTDTEEMTAAKKRVQQLVREWLKD